MNVSTGPMDDPAAWRLRLRLLYRAYRYRWRDDAAEIACVRRWTRPGTVALDVGAHKGSYTYWLARRVGPQGRVYAFEPQQALARNLRRSFDPARVIVEHAAVSDREGTMTLHVPADGRPSPSASLEMSAASPGCAVDVRVIMLDRYLPTGPAPVSFLKCDVEGHELSVLNGAASATSRGMSCMSSAGPSSSCAAIAPCCCLSANNGTIATIRSPKSSPICSSWATRVVSLDQAGFDPWAIFAWTLTSARSKTPVTATISPSFISKSTMRNLSSGDTLEKMIALF